MRAVFAVLCLTTLPLLTACASVDPYSRTTDEWTATLMTASVTQLQKPPEAMDALEALEARGAESVPALERTLRDREIPAASRIMAVHAICRLGEDARPAVPAIVDFIEEPQEPEFWSTWTRVFSLWNLRQLGPAAEPALPYLIGQLNGKPRYIVAQTIGAIGPAASDAVPALAKGLRHDDERHADACRAALRSILALDEE